MKFARPEILWLLCTLALPVIIHLLRLRRYKRAYFSDIRLLEQIRQERKRSSRLREIWVLVSRMLLMASLVLAFARPYIPAYRGQTAEGSRTRVSIYLDNSFSMQAPSKEAVLLEKAKARVEEILQSLPHDASLQFLTNDFSGEQLYFRSPDAVREALGELDYCPVPRSFVQVADFQRRAFEAASVPPASRLCYYVSDFQKSTWGEMPADSQSRCVLVPVTGTDYDNLSLDSLGLEVPVLQAGRDMGLYVFLTNRSEREQLQVPLRLYVNNVQTGVYPIDCQAGEKVSLRLPFRVDEPGIYGCYAEIADYPIDFDNRLYFSLRVGSRAQVLHIASDAGGSNPSLARLFDGDSSFSYVCRAVSALDYEAIPAQNLIILDGADHLPSALCAALARYVREGGSLAVIPGVDAALMQSLLGASYGEPIESERRIRYINASHPVFSLALEEKPGENLLPLVKSFYALPEARGAAYETLLAFNPAGTRPKEDFLRVYSVDKGLLYLFSAKLDADHTDFCRHYTFVVSFLNMALFQGSGPRLYYTVGTEEGLFIPAALVRHASGGGGSGGSGGSGSGGSGRAFGSEPRYYIGNLMPLVRKIGSEIAFYTYGQIQHEGNYKLSASDSVVMGLSFNYDRAESEKACLSSRELESLVRAGNALRPGSRFLFNPDKIPLSKSVRELDRGRELWKLFVIFALIFALCETILLRWKIF